MKDTARTCLCCWRSLLFAGCSKKTEEKAEEEHVVTVDVAPVLSSPISQKVTADALLYPLQQAAIVPKISAPVKKFYVDRGAAVRAGQLLAELENRDLAGAVAENQARMDQAEANYQTVSRGTVPEELQKAELDVRTTKDRWIRSRKLLDSRQSLYKEGAISQKEVNDAPGGSCPGKESVRDGSEASRNRAERVGREQAVKAAAAQRDAAKGRVESAQAQLSLFENHQSDRWRCHRSAALCRRNAGERRSDHYGHGSLAGHRARPCFAG